MGWRNWSPSTPAAIVSGAATNGETVWTGRLEELPLVALDGKPGVIVVGEVVGVRALVARLAAGEQASMGEVRHGRY